MTSQEGKKTVSWRFGGGWALVVYFTPASLARAARIIGGPMTEGKSLVSGHRHSKKRKKTMCRRLFPGWYCCIQPSGCSGRQCSQRDLAHFQALGFFMRPPDLGELQSHNGGP